MVCMSIFICSDVIHKKYSIPLDKMIPYKVLAGLLFKTGQAFGHN